MDKDARIPTNLRTLLILEVLGQNDGAMTATEINDHIGLPKQTVHRLCTTLEAEGFLIREDGGRRFRPSRRLREMGMGLLHASRNHIARHQVLQDVAAKVRETVNFVVPEDSGMSYLDRVETDWPFRIQLPVGSHVPFHCTASGKIFMASLRPAARKAFVAGICLERRTPHTITKPTALMEELALTARRGYALDREELIEGMVAIAVPVTDGRGRFTAALAFHGPIQRIDLDQAVEQREVLLDGARRLREAIFS